MNAIAATMLFLGLSLSSLYIFPSGQPQPADLLLLGFAGMMTVMALGDERLALSTFTMSWALLAFWVLLVTLGWSLILGSTAFLVHLAFFLFNFLVGMALLRFLRVYGERAKGWIRNGVAIALLVAASQVLMQLSSGILRTTGSFNNPNQLAYFALCGILILMLLDDFRPPLRSLALTGMAAGVVSILGASSLGAMGGGIMILVGWALANAIRVRHFARLLLLVPLLLIVAMLANINSDGQVLRNLEARFDRAPDKVEGMYEERRFDRLSNFPEYAILGAGEAERQRFAPYHRSEIHSSFVNMLFAYGVPGLGLFLLVIFAALRRAPLYAWIGVSAPLLYSVAHNGIRSTLFWMVLALCWYLYRQPRRASVQTSSA